jgi:Domain of unknown function (DUF4384)
MMKPAAVRILLIEALCLLVLIGAAKAQTPGSAGQGGSPRERSVKVLTDVPDSVPQPPSISPSDLASINQNMKTDNAAGLSLDIIPSGEVIAGSRIGFRLATKKPGYLILLNVDAAGKLTQIFPEAPTETGPVREAPSLIKPGKPLVIPQLGSPYATFEFIADPPAGLAMVIGLLSDKPVQLVDLPNAPPPAFAPADTLKYVREQTLTLVVPSRNGDRLERPSWSFDGKVYLIK